MTAKYDMPDALGHFGPYGGIFVAETLMPAITELNQAYQHYLSDQDFVAELDADLKHYVGRPSPLYHAERWSRELGGAQIYLKREDLNHTGAHKVNNTVGQALLAKRGDDFDGVPVGGRFGRDGADYAELGDVGAGGEFDGEVRVARLGVELIEALADIVGADANDCVLTGIVISGTVEDFNAEDALLEAVVFALEGEFDEVAEEFLASTAAVKGIAQEDLLEGVENLSS